MQKLKEQASNMHAVRNEIEPVVQMKEETKNYEKELKGNQSNEKEVKESLIVLNAEQVEAQVENQAIDGVNFKLLRKRKTKAENQSKCDGEVSMKLKLKEKIEDLKEDKEEDHEKDNENSLKASKKKIEKGTQTKIKNQSTGNQSTGNQREEPTIKWTSVLLWLMYIIAILWTIIKQKPLEEDLNQGPKKNVHPLIQVGSLFFVSLVWYYCYKAAEVATTFCYLNELLMYIINILTFYLCSIFRVNKL